jgi:hypothetical protein
MDEAALQRLIDIEAIREMKARYFRYVDNKEWNAYGNLYAEEIDFEPDPKLGRPLGADNPPSREDLVNLISTFLEGTTTVHTGHTSEIEITGPDTARGIWSMSDYVVWPSDGPPVGYRGYGHYHEEYVRTPDGWKIKRRRLTRLRLDPLEGGLPTSLLEKSE